MREGFEKSFWKNERVFEKGALKMFFVKSPKTGPLKMEKKTINAFRKINSKRRGFKRGIFQKELLPKQIQKKLKELYRKMAF